MDALSLAAGGGVGGKNLGRCLAILGTGSDVGKSIVVTALCRLLRRAGVDVAPYKAQNMSNNSYVTALGGEMGRAQVVQAQAARVEPHVDMNPVLLKPDSDTGAQVIVHGKVVGSKQAREYFADTDGMFGQALASLERLRARHELIVMEGAGSCAEVNLRARDFVNFRMAHAVDAPVVLVADIDRGGVFGQVVGTLAVIPPEDLARVKGILINRFRGDARLFDDGIEYLQQRTGLPVLGLVPFLYELQIDSEDGMPLEVVVDPPQRPVPGRINIAVIRLPHISNFTDFAPLAREAAVRLHYLAQRRSLADYDLVILPGCKNVRGDLNWLRQLGWDQELKQYRRQGGRIGGVCGGYQMLGSVVEDPHGVESQPGTSPGLAMLPVHTVLAKDKLLTRTQGRWRSPAAEVDGYEIHMGRTVYAPAPGDAPAPAPGAGMGRAGFAMTVTRRNGEAQADEDGCVSADGRVWGTYLHGLFDAPGFRRAFLEELRPDLADQLSTKNAEEIAAFRDRQYDLLAEHFAKYVDMAKVLAMLGMPVRK